MKEEHKSKLNKEVLDKYSWAIVASDYFNAKDEDGAAYALKMYNEEHGDIHTEIQFYKKDMKKAIEDLTEKYVSAMIDAPVGEYLNYLGVKESLGGNSKLNFSEINKKMKKAKLIYEDEEKSDKERLKAEKELQNYNLYLNLIKMSEQAYASEKKGKIDSLKRDGLVKAILEAESEQSTN